MTKIFMSYRREESALEAEFIRDRFRRRMKEVEVFYDLDSISVGQDFKQQIDRFVASADFFLALIGRKWLTTTDSSDRRRLDDPEDFVRLEIETALGRDMPVIPVLLNGTPMPEAAELPESLRPLVMRQAHFVRRPPDFKKDVDALIRKLKAQQRLLTAGGEAREIAFDTPDKPSDRNQPRQAPARRLAKRGQHHAPTILIRASNSIPLLPDEWQGRRLKSFGLTATAL